MTFGLTLYGVTDIRKLKLTKRSCIHILVLRNLRRGSHYLQSVKTWEHSDECNAFRQGRRAYCIRTMQTSILQYFMHTTCYTFTIPTNALHFDHFNKRIAFWPCRRACRILTTQTSELKFDHAEEHVAILEPCKHVLHCILTMWRVCCTLTMQTKVEFRP